MATFDEVVSEDETEDPVPNISLFLSQPDASPDLITSVIMSVPGAEQSGDIDDNPITHDQVMSGIDGTDQPVDAGMWQSLMSASDNQMDPKLLKDEYVDYSKMGTTFKAEEVVKNIHELDPSSIPNVLKHMAHLHIFIPLMMFTSESFRIICDNVGDLYTKRKTGFAAGKYILNSDLFPNENTLTEQTFFQAYRSWVKLLTEVVDELVSAGWHAHHTKMISDADFSNLFVAWRMHDRQLCTSFFNAPFILDVESNAYTKGFDHAWMTTEINSFRARRSSSGSDQHSFHGSRQSPHNGQVIPSSASSINPRH